MADRRDVGKYERDLARSINENAQDAYTNSQLWLSPRHKRAPTYTQNDLSGVKIEAVVSGVYTKHETATTASKPFHCIGVRRQVRRHRATLPSKTTKMKYCALRSIADGYAPYIEPIGYVPTTLV